MPSTSATRELAGAERPVVDQDGAGPAHADAAAALGPGQIQVLAQEGQQVLAPVARPRRARRRPLMIRSGGAAGSSLASDRQLVRALPRGVIVGVGDGRGHQLVGRLADALGARRREGIAVLHDDGRHLRQVGRARDAVGVVVEGAQPPSVHRHFLEKPVAGAHGHAAVELAEQRARG